LLECLLVQGFWQGYVAARSDKPKLKRLNRKENNMRSNILPKMACVITVVLWCAGVSAQILSDQVIFTPTGFNQIIPENGPPGSEFLPAFAPLPGFGDQVVLLLEPGTSAPVNSDALWVQNGFLYFESDDENGNLPNYAAYLNSRPGQPPPPTTIIPETGALQDIGVLLINVAGAPLPPQSLLVASDIDVPEPSTFALLAIGGLVIGAGIRRKVS
jgi:hypothetical protein